MLSNRDKMTAINIAVENIRADHAYNSWACQNTHLSFNIITVIQQMAKSYPSELLYRHIKDQLFRIYGNEYICYVDDSMIYVDRTCGNCEHVYCYPIMEYI